MPALIGALGRVLLWALGTFLGRLLLNLGVGFISYTGASALISAVQSDITAHIGGLSAQLSQLLTVLNVPQAISILFGAVTTRASLSATSKLVVNPGGK